MDAIVFWLVVVNIAINAYVLNEQLKHLNKLKAFVAAANVYGSAYNLMVHKLKEYVEGFNDLVEVTNNQADMLKAIVSVIPPLPKAQERPTMGTKRHRVSKAVPTQSTDTE